MVHFKDKISFDPPKWRESVVLFQRNERRAHAEPVRIASEADYEGYAVNYDIQRTVAGDAKSFDYKMKQLRQRFPTASVEVVDLQREHSCLSSSITDKNQAPLYQQTEDNHSGVPSLLEDDGSKAQLPTE